MFGKKAPPSPEHPPSEQESVDNPSLPVPTQESSYNSPPPSDASSQLPAAVPGSESSGNGGGALEEIPGGEQERQLVDSKKIKSPTISSAGIHDIEVTHYVDKKLETPEFVQAKSKLIEELIKQVDFVVLEKMKQDDKSSRVTEVIDRLLGEMNMPLNAMQIEAIKEQAMDEIFGYGPIEPLLQDNDISDIMINGPNQIFVEKRGKMLLTDVTFMDGQHLLNVIQRIVSRVGRRVDEASPMVDARMPDGSRFNAIIPPLALDGALVSIRKFKKNKMPLSQYVEFDSMTPEMCRFLEICGHVRLNMIVSGGTGSGKTTLLNALSGHITPEERVITIEDAAELQLHQPHVLRLETRPASVEGKGEINQRQLVKNALRMRPDRIILGEIRGDEIIDMISAMNTGHDGSMATIHANSPRDCLARIENLVGMSAVQIGTESLRQQIASAVNIIVQIERMRDGKRRIVQIEELAGMEGSIFTTQTLFQYQPRGMDPQGNLIGDFTCYGIRPKMLSQAEYFGKDKEVLECMNVSI